MPEDLVGELLTYEIHFPKDKEESLDKGVALKATIKDRKVELILILKDLSMRLSC